MLRRVLVIAAVVTSLICSASTASAESRQSGRTGYSANGRYFGFVPAHEKIAKQQKESAARHGPTLAPPPTDAAGHVVPASWHEMNANRGSIPGSGPVLGSAAGDFTFYDGEVVIDQGPLAGPEAVLSPDTFIGDDPVCGGCEPAYCKTPWIWVRAEYLLWWTDGMLVPPLATTSPVGTPREQAGVLRQRDTTILFGNSAVNKNSTSGVRITLGTWFDPCATNGLEVSYFALGEETERFAESSNTVPILARPFFNVDTRLSDSRLIAFDGLVAGRMAIEAATEFKGLGALYRHNLTQSCFAQSAVLVGYRWAQLRDGLLITENTTSLDPNTAGTDFELFDRFETQSDFHGIDVGLSYEFLPNRCYPCWSIELLGKVAVGNTNSTVEIAGQTTETAPGGAPSVRDGGLLTQPTNIGTYSRDEFTMVYEAGLTLRRHFRNGLELTMGYSLIYWSDVARAGDQIDFAVNPTQIIGPLVGPARPEPLFNTTGFTAQGLHFGASYSF